LIDNPELLSELLTTMVQGTFWSKNEVSISMIKLFFVVVFQKNAVDQTKLMWNRPRSPIF